MEVAAHYVGIGVVIAAIIYSIVLHEVAHAYAAFRMGDPSAAMMGRLTLNPAKHVDPMMTILMPLVLFVISRGQFVLGGAKPVPVYPHKFRNPKLGMMVTGAAGPTVNFTIMLVCALLLRIPGLSYQLAFVVAKVGWLNLVLAVFNLVPIPPLDGSRIVAYFLPPETARAYNSLGRFGLLFVLLFMMTGTFSLIIQYPLTFYVWLGGDKALLGFAPLFG